MKAGLVLLLQVLPATAALAGPGPGGFETGLAAGLTGTAASCDLGLGSAGGFEFSAGLSVANPWTALAPAAELRAGASIKPWRSELRIEASILGGLALVPKAGTVAPFGGCALGFDVPLKSPAFGIRTEILARFGGREFEVSAAGPAGLVRYVDSWAPATLDLQVGLRWRPRG